MNEITYPALSDVVLIFIDAKYNSVRDTTVMIFITYLCILNKIIIF